MSADLLLAVDTAGPVAGVALLRGSSLEGSWCARVVRGAETRLAPAIGELLRGRQPSAVAVAQGPGAFTGLRVGVATALGLAVAADCPVVPVSSLQARAGLVPDRERVLALLDARKGRFYGGLFDTRPPVPVLIDNEGDLPLDELLRTEPAVAVGEGAAVARDAVLAAGHRVALLPDANPATALARIAAVLLASGGAIAPWDFRIRYLRPPDAKPPRDLLARGPSQGPHPVGTGRAILTEQPPQPPEDG